MGTDSYIANLPLPGHGDTTSVYFEAAILGAFDRRREVSAVELLALDAQRVAVDDVGRRRPASVAHVTPNRTACENANE